MIHIENLTYAYAGAAVPAIQDLSFAVESGEVFGFLGPSGAGKSTTQKILIRLLQGFDGTASVMGRDLRDWGGDYFERIGVSFELPNHYSKLTGTENLRYFGALYQNETISPIELLRMVGLEDAADMPVGQYSKGMKNRLSVVRALAHRPELLFLDEPTAGLDPLNSRNIRNLIQGEKTAGRTVFLTTHDMTVADELCDRVALIVDGRISVIDSPHDLKLQYGRREVRVEYSADGQGELAADFPLDGLGNNAEFIALLRDKEVETIHTREATLETAFIEITGRGLE